MEDLRLLAGNWGKNHHRLPCAFFRALFLSGLVFSPNTRAKILSTFFSWRGRSKAYSIWRRGTRADGPRSCLPKRTHDAKEHLFHWG